MENFTKSTTEVPGLASQTLPTKGQAIASQPQQGHKRPLEPPNTREIVLLEAKWAAVHVDLTGDPDYEPPLKVRKIGPQSSGATNGLTNQPIARNNTLLPNTELLGGKHLVGYTTSSSGSPEITNSEPERTNSDSASDARDQSKPPRERDSSTPTDSQPQVRSEKLPFVVDEGYHSFSPRQENVRDSLDGLTEDGLANKFIASDLRSTSDGSDPKLQNVFPLNRPAQFLTAFELKHRTENEGVEKSRRLREAARPSIRQPELQRHSDKTKTAPKPAKLTQEQVSILHMFGRNENGEDSSNVNRRDSKSSVRSRVSSDGTIVASGTEDTKDISPDGDDGSVGDLFCNSQESAITCLDPGRSKIQRNGGPAPLATTAYAKCFPTSIGRTSNEGEPQSPDKPSRPVPNNSLKVAARQLNALTKSNEKRKTGAKTQYIFRHKLDVLNNSCHQKPRTDSSTSSNQKFYSPFGDHSRTPAKQQPQTIEQASENADGSNISSSVPDRLQAAGNRSGGLSLLAQTTSHVNGATTNELVETPSSFGTLAQVAYPVGTVTADSFEYDFSTRYQRPLSQTEKEVVRRHEWLKERQKNLTILKQTYVEAAKLSCIVGITVTMDSELAQVDEFKEIVLEAGEHNLAKRTRVRKIKDSMVRRQTCDVAEDKIEEKLAMLASRACMQKIEDELKIAIDGIELLALERDKNSTKRGEIRSKGKPPKKQVRFESPSSGRPVSQSLRGIPNGTVINQGGEPKPGRPKRGTEEYRQWQKDAFENADDRRRAALEAALQRLHSPAAAPASTENAAGYQAVDGEEVVLMQDNESVVSEEEDGFDIYPTMESAGVRAAAKPSQETEDVSMEDMATLDEERKQQETQARLQGTQPAPKNGTVSSQRPDPELAARMQRARLAIPDQDVTMEYESDAESCISDDSVASVQIVNNYLVYGRYMGVSELEDCARYTLGRFLEKENAEQCIRQAVHEFTEFRRKDMALAMETGDQAWLDRLGDPEEGTMEVDFKKMEQIINYPASSCRIYMKVKEVVAETKQEKRAGAPGNTYEALWKKTMPDGSVDTPNWGDVIPCTNAPEANRIAANIMRDWYAEHMEKRYLDGQKRALDAKVRDLGRDGLFREEDSFSLVPGGEAVEKMEVWVGVKRMRGAGN